MDYEIGCWYPLGKHLDPNGDYTITDSLSDMFAVLPDAAADLVAADLATFHVTAWARPGADDTNENPEHFKIELVAFGAGGSYASAIPLEQLLSENMRNGAPNYGLLSDKYALESLRKTIDALIAEKVAAIEAESS